MFLLAKSKTQSLKLVEGNEKTTLQSHAQIQISLLLDATASTFPHPRPATQMLLLAARQRGLNLPSSMIKQKLISSYPLIRSPGKTWYGLGSMILMRRGIMFGRMAPHLGILIGSLASQLTTQVQAVWHWRAVTQVRPQLARQADGLI